MSRLGVHAAVRGVIVGNIPAGFIEESDHYVGRQSWVVPAGRCPNLPRGRTTAPIVALGERKSYVALLLMGLYYDPTMSEWLTRAWGESGCPLSRGAVTLRLRCLEDVPLDVVAEAVARLSVEDVIAFDERRNHRGVVQAPARLRQSRPNPDARFVAFVGAPDASGARRSALMTPPRAEGREGRGARGH